MQSVISDMIRQDQNNFTLTMYTNKSLDFSEGLPHVLRLLHKFIS